MKKWPLYGTALVALGLSASAFHPADEHAPDVPLSLTLKDEPNFTVNFPDVPIIEFVKFVSKIGDINFVYNQDELNFNVSIVSEDETSLSSVMAILVQVLRINGFSLLEQDGNLIIHKNPAIKEIPTVVSSEVPLKKDHIPPLVTRVFAIRNGNPTSIAEVIRPMLSPEATLEVSLETRHLIVSDVSTNIEKISEILLSLDAPQASLDMEVYRATNAAVEELTILATQILTPIAEGNPLIFVPQPDSNSIFIVSTPSLIERAMATLEDLDLGQKDSEGPATLYVYKIQYIGRRKLENGLHTVAEALPDSDTLHHILETMHYVPESNSIAFRGSPAQIKRLQDLLATLDNADQAERADNFFIYHSKSMTAADLLHELESIAKDLDPTVGDNEPLVEAIEHIKVIPSTNSLMITGNPIAIAKVQALIHELDSSHVGEKALASNFFLYKPKYSSPKNLKQSLETLAEDLEAQGLSASAVLRTIQTARVVDHNHSLLFTGTEESITRVKELLAEIDTPAKGTGVKQVGQSTFLVYKIQYADPHALLNALRNVASDLQKTGGPNKEFATTIQHMRYIPETNSIIFTGPSEALEKANALAIRFDTKELAKDTEAPRMTPDGYVIYHPQSRSGPELIHILQDFESHLTSSGFQDKALNDTIRNLKFMERTNSILISGTQAATSKAYELLERFDVPGQEGEMEIGKIDEMSFLIYKLQYHRGPEIETALRQMGDDLRKLKDADKHTRLINSIDSVQWLEVTNSLVATGNEQTLAKLKQLIKSVDAPLKQVFIEVLVLQTSVRKGLEFGLRWASQGKYRDKLGYGTGSFPSIVPTQTDPLNAFNTNIAGIDASNTPNGQDIPIGVKGGWDLGVIGDIILHKGSTYFALGSLVDALQQDNDSTIVLNQKIVTQDNKNSNLFNGQNVPFTGSTLQVTAAQQSQSTNIEYRDVGVSLSITPILGDDGLITMEIDQEISELESDPITAGQNALGILTSKTSTQTTVTMPNKHFLALSGNIRNATNRSKTSIPCLGGLPIIGAAFSQNAKQADKTSVIVFVRPHIINSYDEYKEITERQEDITRSQSHQEDYDAGLELVKTPDDE